jgi:hypothetical protein
VSLKVLPPGREVEPAAGRAIHCLDDGRVVVWEPAGSCGAIACHAEPLDREPREAVVRSFGLPRSRVAFACAWSSAQVIAQLVGVPVWSFLARGARQAGQPLVKTVTLVRPELGLVVSLGMVPSAG